MLGFIWPPAYFHRLSTLRTRVLCCRESRAASGAATTFRRWAPAAASWPSLVSFHPCVLLSLLFTLLGPSHGGGHVSDLEHHAVHDCSGARCRCGEYLEWPIRCVAYFSLTLSLGMKGWWVRRMGLVASHQGAGWTASAERGDDRPRGLSLPPYLLYFLRIRIC